LAGDRKQEIITFKVDASLWQRLRAIPNRSEFIRAAVQAALAGTCPLCKGTGTLTPHQRKHWAAFSENHALEQCDDCHAIHLVCLAGDQESTDSTAQGPNS
jgi:hypothetical protein